jgi:fatty-acyl-CoA synthase
MIVSGEAPERVVWQERTLSALLDLTAAAHGARTATIDGDERMTWGELRERVIAIAKGMLAVGLRPGDHVGLFLPNCAEFLILWLAAARIGAVTIPFNTRYGRFELEHVLRDSDARAIFLRDGFLNIDAAGLLAEIDPLSRPDEFPRLRHIRSIGAEGRWPSLDALAEEGAKVAREEVDSMARSVSPGDTAIIVYTSGSTGAPKGVMHSHNVLRNECAIAEWLAVDESSVILGHMPFFHVAGGFSALLPALLTGASVVFVDHWDPSAALRLIEERRISIFGGIATHYLDLVEHPGLADADLSSLKTGWMGGALNPRELIEAVHERLPLKVFPVYGMTETTSVTTYPRWHDPFEVYLAGQGVPISDFELKTIDVETGAELGPGESGEVCVRGHLVMQGYYKQPTATAEALDAEGWFHTGDVGRLAESGHLAIVGRTKDMFIVGGNNVYPAEIETTLLAFPEVTRAQVVAVPDERLGEVGFAFVQASEGEAPTEAALTEWARGRLAAYKVPRHWAFIDDWPLLENGKVDRLALQARAIEQLDLDELAERRLLKEPGTGGRAA